MSIKTSKRIALGVIASLVFAPFAAIAPANAVSSTLLASSTTGTVSASASTSAADGTFSVTLREAAATTWTNGTVITLQVVDRYSDADTCTIAANTDGTPAGTVTMSGVSDTLFETSISLPELEVVDGDLKVTIVGANTVNADIEHLVISGLTVKCSTTAPLGNLYLRVTGGNNEIAGASVVATGTLNKAYVDNDTRWSFRLTEGNFPVEALYEAGSTVSFALGATGAATRYVISGAAASPLFLNPAATVNSVAVATADTGDIVTLNNHGLRTGDRLTIVSRGNAVFTDTDIVNGSSVWAIVTGQNTFLMAKTSALAFAGTALAVDDSDTMTMRYRGSGVPALLTTADLGAGLGSVGQQVAFPTNSHLAVSAGTDGVAVSTEYLGKIGTVKATYQYYSTGTQTATAANTTFTTTATAGQISIDETTAGSINDGADTESVVVTLTNGVFYSAPSTLTGASAVSTQTYPSKTLSLHQVTGNITIRGDFRFDAGATAGTFLTFTVAVDNDTDPVGFIGTAASKPSQNRIAILAGATITATPASISAGTVAGAAAPVITITESAAGVWKAGQIVGLCFPDGADDAASDEDTFYTAGGNFPWATVSAGDIKLSGNVSTLKGTMGTAANVMATNAGYNEDVANQCVYWTVFSTSTTASTITINGGNAGGTAAGTDGPVVNTQSLAGVGQVAVIGGGALDAGLVLNTATWFNRTPTTIFTVSVASTPTVAAPGQAQSYGNVTVAESVRGAFAVGAITMTLSDSAGTASTGATLAAAAGANAPVVAQTAASNIIWDYSVAGSVVTINVRVASTDAPASFSITNIKANVIELKSAGVKTANSDLYVTVAGAGVRSNSFINQAAQLAAVATPEVVVPPVAPTLTASLQGGRVLLFGTCVDGEGDMIIYVKSPGKAWQERAKTLECAVGEFDGSLRAPKNSKFYRVKQEGTGLWSPSRLIQP